MKLMGSIIFSRWDESLTWRIALSFIGISLILATLYGVGSYATIFHFIKQNEELSTQKRAELSTQKIQTALVTLNTTLENLSKNTIIVNAIVDSYGRDFYLMPFLNTSRLPIDIPHRLSLCDFKGDIIASSDAAKGAYTKYSGLVKMVVDSGKPAASLIPDNGNTLLICQPVIYPATGTAEGFLALEIPVKELMSILGLSPNASEIGIQVLAGQEVIWLMGHAEGAMKSYHLTLPPPLSALKLSLSLWTRNSQALVWFTFIFLWLVVVAISLSAFMAYRFSRKLTAGLTELDNAVTVITSSGTPQGEVRILGKDEVGRLATSFNSMIKRLKESYDFLETEVAERTLELAVVNTELKRLIALRTSELDRTSNELAVFCYAISHELRAPVARIQGFSGTLLDDSDEEVDKRYIAERIEVASKQLQKVIDAILLLSRLSRLEMEMQDIDFSGLAREVTTEIQYQEELTGASVIIQEGISCRGDLNLIKVCLVNLIGNALKYSSRADKPQVEIGIEENDNGRCYYVRDNGAGFSMEYVDKLFVPFQRLHHQDDFPGTGIGLATVQRIVERHGGNVWAEGKEGEGATFFFTLNVTGEYV